MLKVEATESKGIRTCNKCKKKIQKDELFVLFFAGTWAGYENLCKDCWKNLKEGIDIELGI